MTTIHTERSVRGNSTQILDLNGMLSGIAAAEYSFGTGTSGIFNFNGVKYNTSTGTYCCIICYGLLETNGLGLTRIT